MGIGPSADVPREWVSPGWRFFRSGKQVATPGQLEFLNIGETADTVIENLLLLWPSHASSPSPIQKPGMNNGADLLSEAAVDGAHPRGMPARMDKETDLLWMWTKRQTFCVDKETDLLWMDNGTDLLSVAAVDGAHPRGRMDKETDLLWMDKETDLLWMDNGTDLLWMDNGTGLLSVAAVNGAHPRGMPASRL